MQGRVLAILGRLDRAGRFFETALLVLALGALMVVGIGQIILREFFSFSFIWANELQNLLVLWLAMIATIAACRDDRHIRIDALSRVMHPAAARVARVLVDLFAGAVCIIVAWQLYRYVRIEFDYEDTVLVNVPAWIAHGILPLAFLLAGYRFVVNAIKKAAGLEVGDGSGAGP